MRTVFDPRTDQSDRKGRQVPTRRNVTDARRFVKGCCGIAVRPGTGQGHRTRPARETLGATGAAEPGSHLAGTAHKPPVAIHPSPSAGRPFGQHVRSTASRQSGRLGTVGPAPLVMEPSGSADRPTPQANAAPVAPGHQLRPGGRSAGVDQCPGAGPPVTRSLAPNNPTRPKGSSPTASRQLCAHGNRLICGSNSLKDRVSH